MGRPPAFQAGKAGSSPARATIQASSDGRMRGCYRAIGVRVPAQSRAPQPICGRVMAFTCRRHPENTEWSPKGRCRQCNRMYQQGWWVANQSEQVRRSNANRARVRAANMERLWAYLLAHPCVDCGIADPRVLDADHVRGVKRAGVYFLLHAPWETIARRAGQVRDPVPELPPDQNGRAWESLAPTCVM